MKYEMKQCECGAYRQAVEIQGHWEWTAGCRACDKIKRLYILLEGGVKVFSNGGTNDVDKLKKRVESAEREVERLKAEIGFLSDELLLARINEKRARSSARAAQASAERVRQGCRLAERAGVKDWN